jgi:NTE family protein
MLKYLPWRKKPPRVALALGAGGARGLAHIPALEALDELGIKPVAIAGASMGAVIGASYASGMSGKDIRGFALDTLRGRGGIARRLVSHQLGRMRAHLREKRSLRGTPVRFDAAAVALDFLPTNLPKTFEELKIPLTVVATDFWRRESVLYRSGPLLPAVAGSMAIPGLLRPVEFDGRILVDGGVVNPLPFDLLRADADIVIAIDLTRLANEKSLAIPGAQESLIAAAYIMSNAIVSEKLKSAAPDILLRPNVNAFGALEFARAVPILKAAEPTKEELKRKLGELLAAAENKKFF